MNWRGLGSPDRDAEREAENRNNLELSEHDCPAGSRGEKSAWNAGAPGTKPGSRRSPGGGNGNPLQNSCLENSMDRGAWQATVHGVSESDMTKGLTLYNPILFLKKCLLKLFHFWPWEPSTRYLWTFNTLPSVGFLDHLFLWYYKILHDHLVYFFVSPKSVHVHKDAWVPIVFIATGASLSIVNTNWFMSWVLIDQILYMSHLNIVYNLWLDQWNK